MKSFLLLAGKEIEQFCIFSWTKYKIVPFEIDHVSYRFAAILNFAILHRQAKPNPERAIVPFRRCFPREDMTLWWSFRPDYQLPCINGMIIANITRLFCAPQKRQIRQMKG